MPEAEVINNPITVWMNYGPITLHKPMSREEFIALSDRFPEGQMYLVFLCFCAPGFMPENYRSLE